MENQVAPNNANFPNKNLKRMDKENIIINEGDIVSDSSEPFAKKSRNRYGNVQRWETVKDISNAVADERSSLSGPFKPSNQNSRAGGSADKRGRNRRSRNSSGNRSDEYFINQRLRAFGSTLDLEPIELDADMKFSIRNRLYIGNLTSEMAKDESLREIFQPYGEISDIFINSEKNFAFIRVDYHLNALKAQRALDGTILNGRQLRIRFASSESVVRVRNLTSFVSNELLYRAFEVFGPVERAIVKVDDRGNSKCEGIVEFSKKSSANSCLRLCAENCFFLTATLRPCIVEPMEQADDTIGMPDKALNKSSQQFISERSCGPRFAPLDSFEHEYGIKWKQLWHEFNMKNSSLERELKREEQKLEIQLDFLRNERETEMLRQELRMREADHERRKMEWELLQNAGQNCGYDDPPPQLRNPMQQLDRVDNAMMMRNRASPEQFGYCDNVPMNRRSMEPFGYHNDAQMHRRPSEGMRRQQELSAEFIPQQPFNLDDDRPMRPHSPFLVFPDDDPNGKEHPVGNGSVNPVFMADECNNENKNKTLNLESEPLHEKNSLWGRRTI